MRAAVLVLVGASACGFSIGAGIAPGDGDTGDDALRDGSVDGESDRDGGTDAPLDMVIVPNAVCSGEYRVVCVPEPSEALELNGGSPLVVVTDPTTDPQSPCTSPVNTSTTNSTVGDVCVIARTSITLNATLRGRGSRPLVLFATESITINGAGAIDVASKNNNDGANSELGAGGRTNCMPAQGANGMRGGGAGGSYGAAGGNGGGPMGAMAAAAVTAGELRGGCNGSSGTAPAAADIGEGGRGGGAVLLIAPEIAINGDINASGARGLGGNNSGGGGGGGSGGMIVLDATKITINGGARLWAQGAGGGEGGANNVRGDNGQNPTDPGTAAAGGNGGGNGGPGGAGGVSSMLGATSGSNGPPEAGGGGGGGGYGFIVVRSPNFLSSGLAFPTIQIAQ